MYNPLMELQRMVDNLGDPDVQVQSDQVPSTQVQSDQVSSTQVQPGPVPSSHIQYVQMRPVQTQLQRITSPRHEIAPEQALDGEILIMIRQRRVYIVHPEIDDNFLLNNDLGNGNVNPTDLGLMVSLQVELLKAMKYFVELGRITYRIAGLLFNAIKQHIIRR
ncbi:unnamed protein product [Rotaria sp. Silwood2]|nr:unnamed protein product [Rotaria sp. Silwood2]CAF3542676.1 unnamed protein product [Rotaria sp. Silwood2]CAF4097371.1 unnamed protein product [Rotaria sp. Silwood2]CAF4263573.1 unnamed protein product [Rotaria sp. Silwood2]CAF4790696.1 unnamed protein product [Rotaria sp. Silwood2]